ncbi:STAS domain-containing protein [Actinoplanes sp. NPDC049599]|jgi:anti-anti-sigma factor|uniref:STAS domain-containing protein n=1 Tax=Actinoplanes sp. NPDC049599 TaxID=3363903 RepID=UPI0037A3E5FA
MESRRPDPDRRATQRALRQPPRFRITSNRSRDGIRLCVHGEIDMGTAGQLNRAIAAALSTGPGSVLVDLSATTFCDCTGVAVLLTGRHAALAGHVDYQVVNPTGISLKVMRLCGLETLLTTRTMGSVRPQPSAAATP